MVQQHSDFIAAIPDVLGLYGLWPYGEPAPVAGGTLNWNYRVSTDGGEYFLRRYRDDLETQRISGEHALLKWVAERGIPAPEPEQVPDRTTIAEIAGGRWALFPWVEGEVRQRGTLNESQAHSLGRAHGATQAILASHPASDGAQAWLTWDKQVSLATLARVTAAAKESAAEDWILEALARQTRLLEALEVLAPPAFASLPCQMLHGDFHVAQVLWEADDIVAITDWEVWRTDARVWELVRSLAFSRLLDSPGLEPYLRGYREFITLSEEEARLGLRLWWQSRIVGLWAWQAHFLQGNDRAKEFFRATAAELQRFEDDSWQPAIGARFVRAACG